MKGASEKMKPEAFVLNAARGGIIDLHDLAVALKEGWIAGAAIDVFEPEHLPADHPLLEAPNLIASPARRFSTLRNPFSISRNWPRKMSPPSSPISAPESVVNPEVLELPRWAHLQA